MTDEQIKALTDYTNVLVKLIGTAYREGREDANPFNPETIQDDFTKTQTYKILEEMDKATEEAQKPKVKTKDLPIKNFTPKTNEQSEDDKKLYALALQKKREDKFFSHAARKITHKDDLVWFYKEYIKNEHENNIQKDSN